MSIKDVMLKINQYVQENGINKAEYGKIIKSCTSLKNLLKLGDDDNEYLLVRTSTSTVPVRTGTFTNLDKFTYLDLMNYLKEHFPNFDFPKFKYK